MSTSTLGVGYDDLVTGEAVALELPAASLGLRVVSGLIDMIATYIVMILCFLAFGFLSQFLDDALVSAVGVLVVVLVFVGWPTTWETLTRGKTLGHLVMGLRTVREDAGPIQFRQALTRALVGVPEIYLLSGMPALITAGFSRKGKRLGDMLAGTYVIRERQKIALPPPTPMPAHLRAWAQHADMAPLPDPLAAAIRQFLGRRAQFTPMARDHLGRRLHAEALRYVAPQPPGTSHHEYELEAILAERRARDIVRLQRDDAIRASVLPRDTLG